MYELLPEEWKTVILCPIYKKGDKLECGNYREIALLNVAYKIFANILYQRLRPYEESIIGEYQGGFRWFVDYKSAYDSVIRRKL